MRTLYLRNVPDHVVADLEHLADRAGMSLSAFTIRELRDVARRARNAAVLDGLPDVDVDTADVLASLDDSRADR